MWYRRYDQRDSKCRRQRNFAPTHRSPARVRATKFSQREAELGWHRLYARMTPERCEKRQRPAGSFATGSFTVSTCRPLAQTLVQTVHYGQARFVNNPTGVNTKPWNERRVCAGKIRGVAGALARSGSHDISIFRLGRPFPAVIGPSARHRSLRVRRNSILRNLTRLQKGWDKFAS